MTMTVERAEDSADIIPVANLIARRFHGLIQSRWLIGNDAARRQIFPAWFAGYVEGAMAEGEVHVAREADGTLLGAALWFPGEPSTPDDYDTWLKGVTGPYHSLFVEFDKVLHEAHPKEPHWFLPMIAAEPEHHAGTALLEFCLPQLDALGMPAYLEAVDEATIRLYERHGFVRRPDAIQLPYGPQLYPMWRHPAR